MPWLKQSGFSKFSMLPIHKAFGLEGGFCAFLALNTECGFQEMSVRTEPPRQTPQRTRHLAM